jgi:hypothetical protein
MIGIDTVLDLGCGSGRGVSELLKELEKKSPRGQKFRVFGTGVKRISLWNKYSNSKRGFIIAYSIYQIY